MSDDWQDKIGEAIVKDFPEMLKKKEADAEEERIGKKRLAERYRPRKPKAG